MKVKRINYETLLFDPYNSLRLPSASLFFLFFTCIISRFFIILDQLFNLHLQYYGKSGFQTTCMGNHGGNKVALPFSSAGIFLLLQN